MRGHRSTSSQQRVVETAVIDILSCPPAFEDSPVLLLAESLDSCSSKLFGFALALLKDDSDVVVCLSDDRLNFDFSDSHARIPASIYSTYIRRIVQLNTEKGHHLPIPFRESRDEIAQVLYSVTLSHSTSTLFSA